MQLRVGRVTSFQRPAQSFGSNLQEAEEEEEEEETDSAWLLGQ